MSQHSTTREFEVEGFVGQFVGQDEVRGRLMLAMAQSIADQGFSQTFVADVVRIARVSRRTFYEHFEDREDCFLALCDEFTKRARALIGAAADPALPWREQAAAAIDVYVGFMTADPALTRSFLFEIYSTGERGAAMHRQIHRRFAEQLSELTNTVRETNPELNEVPFAAASAIIAGIGELAMLAIEQGSTAEASDQMRSVAFSLVSDVLTAPR